MVQPVMEKDGDFDEISANTSPSTMHATVAVPALGKRAGIVTAGRVVA